MEHKLIKEELLVKRLFQEKFKLTLEKIKESSNKTPDFWVKDNNEQIAVCEVKTLNDPIHQYNNKYNKSWNSQRRELSLFQRMQEHHSKACQQLLGFADEPKMLVYLNYDMADGIDIKRLLNNVFQRLDLYILLCMKFGEQDKIEQIFVNACNETGKNLYRNYFKDQ